MLIEHGRHGHDGHGHGGHGYDEHGLRPAISDKL